MKQKKKDGYSSQIRQVTLVDDLVEFEKFRDEILPVLRKDMNSGMSAEDIYKKWAPIAAAKLVTVALQSKNESSVLTATKEILDRSEGKARERRDTTHRLAQIPEKELDSLLLSKFEELESVEEGSDGEEL